MVIIIVTINFSLLNYKKCGDEMDLVFIVDSSSSLGENNFENELKFVTKFLSDFTVSYDLTRVAVITYGDYVSIQQR